MPPRRRKIVPTFMGCHSGLALSQSKARADDPAPEHTLDCTRTLLDHAAFPHILSAIIAYAPLSALLPLRATCTEYRDRIDALLFSHVAASIPRVGPQRGGQGQASLRDIELREALPPPSCPGPDSGPLAHARLPFLPYHAAELPGRRRDVRQRARKRQLGLVRVIDFGEREGMEPRAGPAQPAPVDIGNVLHPDYDDGFDDATAREGSLRAAASLLAPHLAAQPRPVPLTVRRCGGLGGDAAVHLAAATYVDYLALWDTAERNAPSCRITVPPCTTYVLHLAYNPFWPRIWEAALSVCLPPAIREISVVLAPFVSDGPMGDTRMPPRGALGLLHDLVLGFVSRVPGATLKLVGVENMYAFTLGYVPDGEDGYHTPDQVVTAVRGMLELLAHQPLRRVDPDAGFHFAVDTRPARLEERIKAVERISMPTFEEWEASLPAADRAILAIPPQYRPPL